MEQDTKEALLGSGKNLSPEALEKRRKINKKIFKFLMLPIVIICGLVLLIAIIPNGIDDPPIEKADTNYTTYHAENSKGVPIFSSRNFGEVWIYSNAQSFKERAQTCLLAAKRYLEKENLKYVRVFLLPYGNKILVGEGSYIAKCKYAPDGKGEHGTSNLKHKTWQASAFEGKVDKKYEPIISMWYRMRDQYKKKTKYGNVTDEIALKQAISKTTKGNVSPQEIDKAFLQWGLYSYKEKSL